MKKAIITTVIALGFAVHSWGQEKEIVVKGNYYLDPKEEIGQLKSLDKSNNEFYALSDTFEGKKYKLSVTEIKEGLVSFKFWHFTGNESLQKVINGEQGETIYELPLDDFKRLTSPLYDRIDWRAGVYTIPFKLRFSDFNFDANVNLGTNIGAKIRWNRTKENGFAIEPIFGIGIASIGLNDGNSTATTATNVSAFSANLGVLFHITNEINFGVTWGMDRISVNDQKHYDWQYNGKSWLGLGVNISFSKENKNTGDKQNNNYQH